MNNNEEEYPDLPEIKLIPAEERWAIAQTVFGSFKLIMGGLLIGGFLTVTVSMLATKGNAELTVKIMKEAVVPFIEEVLKFAATVFGPLLAFILGFYFRSLKS
jgi:hypothetical protein